MNNPTLRKALHLLVHPATLAAIGVLLLNDHLLRRALPSVLTGKLGDFAWLFFSPLLVAALLALTLPGSGPRRSAVVGMLAFGSVAAVFGLVKTVPIAHEVVVTLAEHVLGFPVGWRRDPTDLLALIVWAASASMWARTPEPADGHIEMNAPGWVALTMATLLTVANSPAPDPGIYCLEEHDGEVQAHAAYSSYRSTDGGLTWNALPNQPHGACPNPWGDTAGAAVTATDRTGLPKQLGEQRRYRFTPGQDIEFSGDGGATWRTVYQIQGTSEAAVAVTRRRLSSYAMVRPAPMDVKIDRRTGNAIFAMGHAGVLVQDVSGGWREVAVGGYQPAAVGSAFDFFRLLVGEILLAVGLVLLGFNTLASRAFQRGKAFWIIALVVAWLIWAVVVFLFPPVLARGYGSILTYGAMLVLGVILLTMTVIALVGLLQEDRGGVGRPLLISVVGGVLFLLPYALWTIDACPRYPLAALFGTLLGVATLLAGSRCAPGRHALPR